MSIISEFYKRLRDLCEERNMTVNELAKSLELSSGSPTAWKSGTIPRQSTLQKIADYFGVSVGYLLGTEDGKKEKPTVQDDGLSDEKRELIQFIKNLPEDKVLLLLQVARSIR